MSDIDYLTDPETRRLRKHYQAGCGEQPCREAHRNYEREAKRRRERPDSGWVSPFVDEETRLEVIEHLRYLASKGVGHRRVHAITGITVASLRMIRSGRRQRIKRETANAILGVGLHKVPPKKGHPRKVGACTST